MLPPNMYNAKSAKIVVIVVFIVLDRVSLTDLFNKEIILIFLNFFKFSLIRSYTQPYHSLNIQLLEV